MPLLLGEPRALPVSCGAGRDGAARRGERPRRSQLLWRRGEGLAVGWGGGARCPCRLPRVPAWDGSCPSSLRRDNELRPQLGESGALRETPARMGGQSAPANAKAAAGAGAGAGRGDGAGGVCWCSGGGGGGEGLGHLPERGRSSEEREALAGPRCRVSPCPCAPVQPRAQRLPRALLPEVPKSSPLASFVSAAPPPLTR